MGLKENILNCYNMCDYVDSRIMTNEMMPLKYVFTKEIAKFFYYCSNQNKKETQAFIKKYLIVREGQTAASLIEDIDADYIDFEKQFREEIPRTLHHFAVTDSTFRNSDTMYNCKKAEYFINTYKFIDTQNKATLYIEMLKKYALDKKQVTSNPSFPSNLVSIEYPEQPKEEEQKEEKTLEELMEELNDLTGLASVKAEINSLVNLVKISKIREEKGMKAPNVSKHMVFTGNPGTGKTTVARLLGGIYKSLGVLTKGQLIEVDRSGLVAGYVGQTALKTDEVIKKALGGILFIDEAYTLSEGKGEGDFGQEAIDTILKAMEDNRDNLVVIVAGYPDLMKGFLESNPGLKSRFNKFINFENYTSEELLSIMNGMCKKQEYKLSEEAEKFMSEKFDKILEDVPDDFANARTVRNILEFGITNQATRIVSEEELDEEKLMTIDIVDIENFKF